MTRGSRASHVTDAQNIEPARLHTQPVLPPPRIKPKKSKVSETISFPNSAEAYASSEYKPSKLILSRRYQAMSQRECALQNNSSPTLFVRRVLPV